MGSNVVIEAVSITIVDGNITIEQTKTESVAGTVKGSIDPAVRDRELLAADAVPKDPVAATNEAAPADAVDVRGLAQFVNGADDSVAQADDYALVTDPPPGRAIAKLWREDEVERLKALYPTHSASVIQCCSGQGSGIGLEAGRAAEGDFEAGDTRGQSCTETEVVVSRCDC